MNSQPQGDGRDHASTSDWLTSFAEISQQVLQSAGLHRRVIAVIQNLADRVTTLEASQEHRDPLPEEFGIEDLSEQQPDTSADAVETANQQPAVQPHQQPTDCTSIDQRELSLALKEASRALPRSSTNPVFAKALIESMPDRLTVTCTNGDYWIKRTLSQPSNLNHSMLVDGRELMSIVSKLPKEQLELKVIDGELLIIDGATVTRVAVESAEDYPAFPDWESSPQVVIDGAKLRQLLSRVAFAGVKGTMTGTTHYTNGVYLNPRDERLQAVATDGHRLATDSTSEVICTDTQGVLMPLSVCGHLVRMLPEDEGTDVSLFWDYSQVVVVIPQFTTGKRKLVRHWEATVVIPLIDVKYPDVDRVMPKQFEAEVEVGRRPFIDALNRINALYAKSKDNPVVHLRAEGNVLHLSGEIEGRRASIDLQCELSGDRVVTALNPQYLLDALRVTTSSGVKVHWQNEVSPVCLTADTLPDWMYLLMPIRQD